MLLNPPVGRAEVFGEEEHFLLQFEDLGGNPKVLIYLIENRTELQAVEKLSPDILKRRANQYRATAEMARKDGLNQGCISGLELLVTSYTIRADIRSKAKRRPVLTYNFFWAGALWPYLSVIAGKPCWHLSEKFVRLCEGEDSANIHESIYKYAKFLKQSPFKGKKVSWPVLKESQKEIQESIWLGIQLCMLGMRGAPNMDDIDKKGLDERKWVKDWGRTKFEEQYYQKLVSLWPLLQLDIDGWVGRSPSLKKDTR